VRRLLLGGEELGAAEVRDAAHADVAVAPRLLGNPLDDIEQVPLLLRPEQVVAALRVAAAPHIDDHVSVAAGHQELADPGLVLAERQDRPLQLAGVDGGRDQRWELADSLRAQDVGG